MVTGTDPTSYEELRQLNIARNNAILSALDIPVNAFAPAQPAAQAKKTRTKSRSEDSGIATRTSARLANSKDTATVALPENWVEPEDQGRRKKPRVPTATKAKYEIYSESGSDPSQSKTEDSADLPSARHDSPRQAQGAPESSRNLIADIALLQPILGERVPGGHVKSGVMQLVSPTCEPKFSKYTGVQEWRNAIFFMLNIMAGNTYSNTFKETADGSELRITYFLSDRTKPDAPVISRIVRSAVRDHAAAAAAAPTLHLFCRAAPGQSALKPGSGGAAGAAVDHCDYVYFGRLAYVRHDAAASPIEFEFRLEDYQVIKQRVPFRQLILLAKHPG